LKPD